MHNKISQKKNHYWEILRLNRFVNCEYAIIWYKQQNSLGQCSKNQSSAGAKFKVINV